jgi:hypothetical protein
LRATYRRERRSDQLASSSAIRFIFDLLREALPQIIPSNEKELIRLLRAARHLERYPATDTRRGRPARFERMTLLSVASHIRTILERETSGRVSFASFVDHYLRVLDFPSDVQDALSRNEINLFEAEQLARLTSKRLGFTSAQARRKRSDLLNAHIQARLSGARLRQRVEELLKTAAPSETGANSELPEDLEDFDPYDPTHLFYDEIKRLGFALREVRPEDLTDDLLEEYLRACEPLWAVLAKIERRRKPVQREILKI